MTWVRADVDALERRRPAPGTDRVPNWVRVSALLHNRPDQPRRRRRSDPPERQDWLVESFELPAPGTPRAEARKPKDLLQEAAGLWDAPDVPGPDLG